MIKKLGLYVYFPQNECIYRKDFDEIKHISFLIKDDELLEEWNEIQKNVKDSLKKEFDSEPVYNEKWLNAKTKSNYETINRNFQNNKIPKEGPQFICSLVILINSVFRKGKNHYLQVFLEKCKYVVKEKQISKKKVLMRKF